ncbi:MAG: Flavobacterium phage [Bacteroidota bacterium]|jgi:hypothetical protein
MASIITELIPDQPFQIIQNRIGEILLEEITAQHALQNLDSSFEFFVERINPYSKDEDVVITLACREQDNQEYTQRNSQVHNIYFVDIFAGGIEHDDLSQSEDVRLKLFKYVGIVKYILNSGKYPTLGFPSGLIGNKHVQKITFDTDYSNWGNHSNYDAKGIRFCRIIFMVKAQESTEGWQGIPLQGNNSIVYTGTDKGTQLTFNN